MPETISDPESKAILQSILSLEQRIARLERHVGLQEPEASMAGALESYLPRSSAAAAEDAELEQTIGEYGLAWAGGIIFLLGIVFLMTYTLNQGHNLLSAVIGYCAGAGLYILSGAWQKSFPYLSRLLLLASLLLSYYTTMRLHYFTADPLISNPSVVLILLIAAVILQAYLAWMRRSEALAALAILLGLISALLGDTTQVVLPLIVAVSALAVYLVLRFAWWRLLNLAIVLSFAAHLLWLVNNPVAGHPLKAVAAAPIELVYLFLCVAVYAWPALFYDEASHSDAAKAGAVFLNCLGFAGVATLAVLAVFQKSYPTILLAASVLLLACSIALWIKTRLQFAPAVYACFGYLSLSAAIYGFAHVPEAFLWLALQSFLVVSMALWFRSRALVVANALIYLGILAAYWLTAPISVPINFAFAFVALGSARVMNWKRERLTLRTDGLRNVYLAISFVMVLYSLYHALPGSYVALSWTVTAVVYFLLSLLLKNVKYRWMSLLNLLATVVYLFLVDLPHLDPRFRVVSFLFLGLMAVGISIFYARLRRLARKSSS